MNKEKLLSEIKKMKKEIKHLKEELLAFKADYYDDEDIAGNCEFCRGDCEV